MTKNERIERARRFTNANENHPVGGRGKVSREEYRRRLTDAGFYGEKLDEMMRAYKDIAA